MKTGKDKSVKKARNQAMESYSIMLFPLLIDIKLNPKTDENKSKSANEKRNSRENSQA
ncbi:hypothetical protein LPTSP3_g32380 [Leptospira kobayashii]|uniref:Uncharacterized protein n=1 Tax=Leptospira kobayashii TaxID=1917830 RepID=A0ABM7UMK1_9LEPT|nr:hypothetical protein [Leptospira kobayashii]BDA80308.1 hypothetical protein LPTSP3_g32380 [Leptospira kobayashii]